MLQEPYILRVLESRFMMLIWDVFLSFVLNLLTSVVGNAFLDEVGRYIVHSV